MQLRPAYPLTTTRLILRPLTGEDADAVLAYRSRPDVCRYVPFEPMDLAGVTARIGEQWAAHEITREGQALVLGVALKASNTVIGDLTLMFHSATHQSGEIGWVLSPEQSGRGYATEAAHRLLHLALDELGLRRVSARVDARNEASLRLAARLGMRREAHLIENEWFKGEWTDEIDFALLSHEWRLMHGPSAGPDCSGPVLVRPLKPTTN